MIGHSGACTYQAESLREAARRLATVLGADAGAKLHEANQTICDSVDLLVQIGIRHEVRRVIAISNVSKNLENGDVYFEPIYPYKEEASAVFFPSSGERIRLLLRTEREPFLLQGLRDLWVMNPTSCHCSTPHRFVSV